MTRKNFPNRVRARREVARNNIESRIKMGYYAKEHTKSGLKKAEEELEVLNNKLKHGHS